jgi:uridine kinase
VPVADALVVEGVGAAQRDVDAVVTLRVWVEAPWELRLRRGVERDGEALRGRWVRWQQDEAAHFERERTRDRADVLVDGTGETAARWRA